MDKVCDYCGKTFEVYRREDQRFCDAECRALGKLEEAKKARALLRAQRERENENG